MQCVRRTDPDASRTARPSREARPLATFRLTRTVALQWLVAAIVGFVASAYCFAALLAALRGESLQPIVIAASPAHVHGWLVGSLVLVALVVVLHESIHGLCMARYGGSTGYGIGVSYFVLPYAYAETDKSFTRTQLVVVLLAPFVGITAVGLLTMLVVPSSVLLVPLAANAAGSIGDLWMAATLLQYPSSVRVTPLPEDVQGFAIYASERALESESGSESAPDASADASDRVAGGAILPRFVAGATGALAVLLAAAVVAVLVSLAFGSGTVVLGDSSGRWLLFRHELERGTVALEVGIPLVLALAAVGGLAWAIVGTVRNGLER